MFRSCDLSGRVIIATRLLCVSYIIKERNNLRIYALLRRCLQLKCATVASEMVIRPVTRGNVPILGRFDKISGEVCTAALKERGNPDETRGPSILVWAPCEMASASAESCR